MLLPSANDKNVTRRLRETGELLGIKVLDHIIFSDESYRSMLENDEWQ
jgi:DNA repair protein RadC